MASKQRFRRAWRSLRWGLLVVLTALWCGMSSPVWGSLATPAPIAQVSPGDSASSLDRQGRNAFAAGQFAAAAQAFEQAAAAFEQQGDRLRQALALSNLSLAQQQLGNWTAAETAIAQSLSLLSNPQDSNTTSAYAQALDIQGTLQLTRGQPEAALSSWEQAAKLHGQLENRFRQLESQINQTQSLQALGLYRRAIALLIAINQDLADEPNTATPNTSTRVTALRNLGDALRVTGDQDLTAADNAGLRSLLNLESDATLPISQSYRILQQALAIAEALQTAAPGDPAAEQVALVSLSLGNAARLQPILEEAPRLAAGQANQLTSVEQAQIETAIRLTLQHYQQAADTATSASTRLQALVNQFGFLVQIRRTAEAEAALPQLQAALQTLPVSRVALYARINLARDLSTLAAGGDGALLETAARLLAEAEQQATQLGDARAIAYTLGALGEVYEQTGQLDQAQRLLQRALQISQSVQASEISYRWWWTLGRVLKAQWQGSTPMDEKLLERAIAAYRQAIFTIRSLRTDLAAINPEVQFAFRDGVEPIHRELVELLLAQSQPGLKEARDIIEGLQLAELDNFFRVACLTAQPELIDQVDEKAAVIYPILLPQQLALIVSLPAMESPPRACSPISNTPTPGSLETPAPGQPSNRLLCYYTSSSASPRQQVEQVATNLQQDLDQQNTQADTLPKLQQMYDWLIRPEGQDLQASGVETLVFVLDGALRNIPMAALNDGQKFLVESYSIAITPGLQLRAPRLLTEEGLRALVGGLTLPREGFSPLAFVSKEVEIIQSELPQSQVLLDEQFRSAALEQAIADVPYSIIHLATHGKFGGRFEDTFILTEDGQLNANQISDLLRTADLTQRGSLELLVLSACQTAEGDDRAALGLAGIAVRSGARSTVATLWPVNDAATAEFMQRFYEELTQDTQKNRAEALRQAQLAILNDPNYRSPYFWAPYILVGNWL